MLRLTERLLMKSTFFLQADHGLSAGNVVGSPVVAPLDVSMRYIIHRSKVMRNQVSDLSTVIFLNPVTLMNFGVASLSLDTLKV